MPPLMPVDALTVVLHKLAATGREYMLTGSVAGLWYGRERVTVDVDVVMDCTGVVPERLAAAFQPEYFVDPEIRRDSGQCSTFNAISLTGGPKIDIIPLKRDGFDQTAFRRRVLLDWQGTPAWVIRGDDLALNKLRWAKDSRSQRQLADVRAILAAGVVSDAAYFERWVGALDLWDVLHASRAEGHDA